MRLALIGLSLLLLAVIGAQWWYYQSRSGTWIPKPGSLPEAGAPERILPVAEEFQLPALASYDMIEERPLFVEGRRPPPEEDEESAEESVTVSVTPPSLSLLGVLITPEGRLALVRTSKPPEVKRLREGDLVDGWKLAEIGAASILFSQGELEESFPLREYKYPAQPPPPAKPPTAAAPRAAKTRAPQRRTNPRQFTPTFGRRASPQQK
jgi:hypothetical protein